MLNMEKTEIVYHVLVAFVVLDCVPGAVVENPDGCVLVEDPVGIPVVPKAYSNKTVKINQLSKHCMDNMIFKAYISIRETSLRYYFILKVSVVLFSFWMAVQPLVVHEYNNMYHEDKQLIVKVIFTINNG